jgi:hypothetical protein
MTRDDVAPRLSVLANNGPVVARQPVVARTEAPASVPAPATPAENRNHNTAPEHDLIISSRPHVGLPNYALHPEFVRSGMFVPLVDTPSLVKLLFRRHPRPVLTSPGGHF